MGTMEDIRGRLETGAAPSDLIAEGYSKSSVYSAQQSLKKRAKVQSNAPRARAGTSSSQDAFPSVVPPLDQDLRNDPEIA